MFCTLMPNVKIYKKNQMSNQSLKVNYIKKYIIKYGALLESNLRVLLFSHSHIQS